MSARDQSAARRPRSTSLRRRNGLGEEATARLLRSQTRADAASKLLGVDVGRGAHSFCQLAIFTWTARPVRWPAPMPLGRRPPSTQGPMLLSVMDRGPTGNLAVIASLAERPSEDEPKSHLNG